MENLFVNIDTATINMYLLIFIIFAIIFGPLYRKIILKILKTRKTKNENKQFNVIEIEQTLKFLSTNKMGAIIAFEREDSLQDYIEKGVKINAKINKELLISIFNKYSPLHDGAIIIANGLIKTCSTFFPSISKKMDPKYGARHRAAIAFTSENDSLVIVVSETTGEISFVENGNLNKIENDEGAIQKELLNLIKNE